MSTSLEPQAEIAPPASAKPERLGRIVRWAARLTSVPIFALLMISLVPALASFAISAKDDQVIALGMCGAALGFVVAWRWDGAGGVLAAFGVGAMLAEIDGPVFADPFSVAFGLQAILFLISWALNSSLGQAGAPRVAWAKRAAICLLVVSAVTGAVVIYRGPGPTRVPKEKAGFVGVWDSGTGFTLEITAEGRAIISQAKDAKVEPCNTPLVGSGRGEYQVNFRGDDQLELASGILGPAKTFHIDSRPLPTSRPPKLVLNGSDPYKRSSGMVLVRKSTPETN